MSQIPIPYSSQLRPLDETSLNDYPSLPKGSLLHIYHKTPHGPSLVVAGPHIIFASSLQGVARGEPSLEHGDESGEDR